MTDEPAVIYAETEGIAEICINQPRRRNALDAEGVAALADAWRRFESGTARVAVLTGGAGNFCAGLDLEAVPDAAPAVPGIGAQVSKPVIAAVDGPAVGLGLALVMQADLCVASDRSVFRYPEGRVGYTGGLIAALATRIPAKIAMEILLLGEAVSPERAREAGLINAVLPPDEVLPRARAMAATIAGMAPLVIDGLRAEIAATMPASPAQLAGQFRARMAGIADSHDRQEGLAAFRERRAPRFEGR